MGRALQSSEGASGDRVANLTLLQLFANYLHATLDAARGLVYTRCVDGWRACTDERRTGMTGRVDRCEACGRVVAGVFPMHACVQDGEERFSIAPYLPAVDDDVTPTGAAVRCGLTLQDAIAWLRGLPDGDLDLYSVTRWVAGDGPWGDADPDRSIDGHLFLHEHNQLENEG